MADMENTTRLLLLRHGQVEGFEVKRYNGQANVPLTEYGRLQMDRACRLLQCLPLAAVYSSDLDRCRYGARRLGRTLGLTAVVEPALREIDCGRWQGYPWERLAQDFPDEWQARLRDIVHFRIPGGESFHDAALRARTALDAILARHPGEQVALFGHGGINRVFLLDALGAPLAGAFSIVQDYACLNVIDYLPDGGRRVRLMNAPCRSIEEVVGPA